MFIDALNSTSPIYTIKMFIIWTQLAIISCSVVVVIYTSVFSFQQLKFIFALFVRHLMSIFGHFLAYSLPQSLVSLGRVELLTPLKILSRQKCRFWWSWLWVIFFSRICFTAGTGSGTGSGTSWPSCAVFISKEKPIGFNCKWAQKVYSKDELS